MAKFFLKSGSFGTAKHAHDQTRSNLDESHLTQITGVLDKDDRFFPNLFPKLLRDCADCKEDTISHYFRQSLLPIAQSQFETNRFLL